MNMMGCTGRITNALINYRCVRIQDKSVAQGLALFLISVFAFIPGPILYGKIIGNDDQKIFTSQSKISNPAWASPNAGIK